MAHLRIDHFFHVPAPPPDERLDTVIEMLQNLQSQGENVMASLDDLKAKVAKNTTVVGSAVALLAGLKTALDEAIMQLPDQTALDELSASLDTDQTALANAITANTPNPPPVP